jgi:hypothetical protein
LPPMPSSPFPLVSHETDLPDDRLEVGGANVIYRYVRHGSDQAEDEVWVEIRLDADWVAVYLIEPEDGQPVIAELRVVPYEDDMERNPLLGPGEWSRRSVPYGGVPVERLRTLRTEDVLRVAQDHIAQWSNEVDYLDDVLADFGL